MTEAKRKRERLRDNVDRNIDGGGGDRKVDYSKSAGVSFGLCSIGRGPGEMMCVPSIVRQSLGTIEAESVAVRCRWCGATWHERHVFLLCDFVANSRSRSAGFFGLRAHGHGSSLGKADRCRQ